MAEDNTISREIRVRGMHCAACANAIETQLTKMGAADVSADFAGGTVVYTATQELEHEQIISKIQSLGYVVEGRVGNRTVLSMEQKFLFSALFTIPLAAHMFVHWPLLHNAYFQLALCLPVFVLSISHFGPSAWRSVVSRSPNMDVLIFIGVSSAFVYSLIGTLFSLGSDFLFYETSATITTLVFLGNLIEERSVKRTGSAIEDLSRLQPQRARVISRAGIAEIINEVDATQIKVGDLLLVASGDRVPTDGVIVNGSASLDESMISGESLPLNRSEGQAVIGGTIVIQGSFKMQARAVGQRTVLANMIRLVAEARRGKAPIQRLADKVSAVFVPIVLGVALLTLAVSALVLELPFSEALLRAIAVLVIACPCAMGLATPTAISVGLGQAAKQGILIKGADTFERFAGIKRVVFDKTGTITSGNFKVVKIDLLGESENFVRSVIVALEERSSHPLAKSLRKQFVTTPALALQEISERRGYGMAGQDADGNVYELGSRDLDPALKGKTQDLFLLRNRELLAALTLEEDLKPNAAELIQELHQKGIQIVLLSGDRKEKCVALAEKLKIDLVYAEKKPEEKLKLIEDLEKDAPTAFVGDGINDAPALERASVGISLSDATQAAINSAKVVLLNGDLAHLSKALQVAQLTVRTIKQNLFWAFFYNALAIPLAAMGYMSPMLAALSMAFSDVIVIGNSLRIKVRGR